MAKYGKLAQKKVEETVKEFKKGKLKSGKGGPTVKKLSQAVAIGLSKARMMGAKMPPYPKKKR
jgi:hypothetical protein